MECNQNNRSDASRRCRPQRPIPPGMNTDCCVLGPQTPARPPARPQGMEPAGRGEWGQRKGACGGMGSMMPGNSMGIGPWMPMDGAPGTMRPDSMEMRPSMPGGCMMDDQMQPWMEMREGGRNRQPGMERMEQGRGRSRQPEPEMAEHMHSGNRQPETMMGDGNRRNRRPEPMMDMMNQDRAMRQDRMTGMPIGMGYVPWQRWGQTYPLSQGFQRGTIFPELDLPFMMGRCH